MDDVEPWAPGALCDYCRDRPADVREWLSRSRWWFMCFPCLEDAIDRENAVHASPALRSLLPSLPSPDHRPGRNTI